VEAAAEVVVAAEEVVVAEVEAAAVEVEAEAVVVAAVVEAEALHPGPRPVRRRGRTRSCCSGSAAPAAADRSCCSE
jgi:hypothetical protein